MRYLFMQENLDLSNIKSLAIGKFDGMHLAHKKLLESLHKQGAIISIEVDKQCHLTPFKEKTKYTKYPIICIPLADIKDKSGKEFIAFLKEHFVCLKTLVVGYDFRFGKDGAWYAEDLCDLFEGEVKIVKEIRYHDMAIHSSMIGDLIEHGDIKNANNMLGRLYSIYGQNIQGQGLGKTQLYPTINLSVDRFILPQNGVYASFCEIDKQLYKSITFIGNRLSTDREFSIETHILADDFTLNAKWIRVFFVDKIRSNKKFNSLPELKTQIKNDIKKAKDMLKNIKVF